MLWLLDPNKLLPLLVGFWSSTGLWHAVRRFSDPQLRRGSLDLGSAALLALVLDVAGFWFLPSSAGIVAITGWFVLVLGPNVGGRLAARRAASRDFRTAEMLCTVFAAVRPLGLWRESGSYYRALRWLSEGQRTAGLGLLDQLARSKSDLAEDARLERLAANHDWEEVYLLCRERQLSGSMPVVWLPRLLRAMGETGRTPELVHAAVSHAGALFVAPQALPHSLLVTFAFTGRAGLVQRVLHQSLGYLDETSRQAWIGTAELTGDAPDAGRRRLEACRATADAQQAVAIDRRLTAPPPTARDVLTSRSQSLLDAMVERWGTIQRYVPGQGVQLMPWATMLIVGLTVVVFAIEEALGGSMNPATLELVGALVPERVLDGEWWRGFTAVFVHMGPLHLAMNGIALVALGAFVERRLGALRTALVFLASGALPMFTHVALSPLLGSETSVGASGGVMGLAGAAGALLAQGISSAECPRCGVTSGCSSRCSSCKRASIWPCRSWIFSDIRWGLPPGSRSAPCFQTPRLASRAGQRPRLRIRPRHAHHTARASLADSALQPRRDRPLPSAVRHGALRGVRAAGWEVPARGGCPQERTPRASAPRAGLQRWSG